MNQITRRVLLGTTGVLTAAAVVGVKPSAVAALEIGDRAPDFTLPATTGGEIRLSQYRGRPVLIEFYGADFSPVWADNLSARKVDYDKFRALNVQILGISADNPFSQKAMADSLKLPYPLLSDFSLETTKKYGVLYGHTEGKLDYPFLKDRVARRAFFLLDREGVVRAKWIGEDLTVFPTEVLLRAAQALPGSR